MHDGLMTVMMFVEKEHCVHAEPKVPFRPLSIHSNSCDNKR
jgi:hypothetical protein